MSRIFIATYDMEIGGVERSLLQLLKQLNYEKYEVDLLLYRHQGDFFHLLPKQVHLLQEFSSMATFRQSIIETIQKKHMLLASVRLLAKWQTQWKSLHARDEEWGYYQMQQIGKYSSPFLPTMDKTYDVAISYLWPHHFVAYKVKAKKKIAWIHTDFSSLHIDTNEDEKVWRLFDHIIAVSDACREAFLTVYPQLANKVMVMENLISPTFIQELSEEMVENPILLDHRFTIVTVARLSKAKGIDIAIQAMKIVKEKGYHNIVWYVIGFGGDEKELTQLIQGCHLESQFILLGKKVNPYPFMKACDLYVQPSRYEGKAVTVSEAQILAKPVLLMNYPTAKSQIRVGVDGYIAGNNPEELASSIIQLYEHPEERARLSRNCQRTNFSNEAELEKLHAICE